MNGLFIIWPLSWLCSNGVKCIPYVPGKIFRPHKFMNLNISTASNIYATHEEKNSSRSLLSDDNQSPSSYTGSFKSGFEPGESHRHFL
jgi:hypothetical protein